MMTEAWAGRCACGSLTYRMTSPPLFVHCCHCRDCQRQTGSAFVVNALIEADRIDLRSGTTHAMPVPTDSGQPHVIHRCPACQTAIWSTYGGRESLRFLRVGTLEDPGRIPPDVHIYARSKLPWVRLPDGARAFEAYYDLRREWPADSLERRRALQR